MRSEYIADSHELTIRAERFCGLSYLLTHATEDLLDQMGTLRVGLAVKKRGPEYWKLYVVSAAAFVALSALEGQVDDIEYEKTKGLLFRGPPGSGNDRFLHLWTHNGTGAVEDCSQFVNRVISENDPGTKGILGTAIGTWIIWNMLGTEPQPDDLRLADAVGHLLASSFVPYWIAAQLRL